MELKGIVLRGHPRNQRFVKLAESISTMSDWCMLPAYRFGLAAALVLGVASCDGLGPENMPPEVIITSPSAGALLTIGDLVEVTVDASDPDGSDSACKFHPR